MHFCIRACDVSALAGRNIFRSRRVAIRRLVESKISTISNDTYNTHNTYKDNRKLITMLRKGPHYQQAVTCNRLSPEICDSAEQECKQIVRDHCTSSTSGTSSGDEQDVCDLFRRYQHLYLKDRGIVVEQKVVDKLKEMGKDIPSITKKDRSFSKGFTSESGEHTYTIYGCVDCIEKREGQNSSLIEIKSRKQQHLRYVHELDQITTYLVISDWPQAYLVEYVNDGIYFSECVTLEEAKQIWYGEIKQPLEKSLTDAAQKIVDLLP